MKSYVSLCLAVALAFSGAALAAPPVQDLPEGIPELHVTTVNNSAFELSAQRGKWVVINYWATWCAPCLREMPDLDDFSKSRDDVVIVGLAYEDISTEEMQEFLKEHPVDYPIAIVDVYDPPAAFPAPRGLPMTWLINPDGKVVERFLGPITARELGKAIEVNTGP